MKDKENIEEKLANKHTGNPEQGSSFQKITNTKLRLIILGAIAGVSLLILFLALYYLVQNPATDNIPMAILISSMTTIVVAIIGVMAGTSLDKDSG